MGGLTYRYVYGLEKENVVIKGITNGAGSVMQYVYNELEDGTGEWVLESEAPAGNVQSSSIVKLWYHEDRLGSTSFLTDNVQGKVTSFVSYDDWGAPTMKAILRMGVRELDLVTEYTGHPYDAVLSMYFAEARMYDAADRRFVAMDTDRGSASNIATVNQYAYCINNPTKYVDPLGMVPYNVLNGIGYALLKNAISPIGAFSLIMLTGHNLWLAGHQFAQVFAFKWLAQKYGFTYIDLEYDIPDTGGKRVDVIAAKGKIVTAFEIKHRSQSYNEDYYHAESVMKGAMEQLGEYFDLLQCYVSEDFYLIQTNYSGEDRYRLFRLFSTEYYINLRHRGRGYIEYWFSAETDDNPNPQPVSPWAIVPQYKFHEEHRKQQYRTLHGLPAFSASDVLLVTVGVVVAGAVVELTVAVAGPAIAAWVVSTASTVSVSVAGAASAAYAVGMQIGSAYQHYAIPGLIG